VRTPLFRPALAAALTLGVLTGCAGTDEPAGPASISSAPAPAPATGGAPTGSAGRELAVVVAGGRVSGDTGRIVLTLGEHVTITVTSDAADEAHLHGYDAEAELTPGTPATLEVDAAIPGVFELELHGSGTVLLTLQVE
jgi:hypothetical protein